MLRLQEYVKKPSLFYLAILTHLSFLLPDKTYLKIRYRLSIGKRLNLSNPTTFNEKLQWLKLYNRNPEYTKMVDKYAVKKIVEEKIGAQFVVPTFGVWDKPEDIDLDSLPNQFVLKTTHGGGNIDVIICKDKSIFDKEAAILRLHRSMKIDIYKISKEWPYKNVKKRIIAEQYLEDSNSSSHDLADYKLFCFNGKVEYLFVATERQNREEPFFNFYDSQFKPLDLKQGHPRALNNPTKPSQYETMVGLAQELSNGIPHVRVDFYEANGKVYFGEMTFFHFGGFVPFQPASWDSIWGDLLILPEKLNQ